MRVNFPHYQLFRRFLEENGTNNGIFKFECVFSQTYSPNKLGQLRAKYLSFNYNVVEGDESKGYSFISTSD